MLDLETRPTGGRLSAEISNAAVQLLHETLGRGPTRAQTTISKDLIVILMGNTQLTAEKSLIKAGEAETVHEIRRKVQVTMREDLVAMVERLSGRKVQAFMSANHISPDFALEAFVLEPESPGQAGAPQG
jgi:uncharacterized protein YbcI